MNKFKKKTRSKMIAASIAILSSAAVVSTGFAAWVISGGDSKTTEGTIQADTVSDASHLISDFAWEADNGTISFGAPATSKGGSLLNYEGSVREKLTATATFKVANLEKGWTISSLFDTEQLAITEIKGEGEAAKYPSDGKLVCALPTYLTGDVNTSTAGVYLKAENGTAEQTGTDLGSFKVTVVFTWGSDTNKENPFVFYNRLDANDANIRASASSMLAGVWAINGAKFKLTIKTK